MKYYLQKLVKKNPSHACLICACAFLLSQVFPSASFADSSNKGASANDSSLEDLAVPAKLELQKKKKTLSGKIISLQPLKDDSTDTPFYRLELETEQSKVTVDMGPKWFPRKHEKLNSGDDVMVFGVTFSGERNSYRAESLKRTPTDSVRKMKEN